MTRFLRRVWEWLGQHGHLAAGTDTPRHSDHRRAPTVPQHPQPPPVEPPQPGVPTMDLLEH